MNHNLSYSIDVPLLSPIYKKKCEIGRTSSRGCCDYEGCGDDDGWPTINQ